MKKQRKTTSSKPSKAILAWLQTERDFRDALLIVSLTINIFILCMWVALQVTDRYDAALTQFFFSR